MPLFDVVFPDISLSMLQALITIATFDVLPTDDLFAIAFDDLPDECDDDDPDCDAYPDMDPI